MGFTMTFNEFLDFINSGAKLYRKGLNKPVLFNTGDKYVLSNTIYHERYAELDDLIFVYRAYTARPDLYVLDFKDIAVNEIKDVLSD
jgi:hypothetical protein